MKNSVVLLKVAMPITSIPHCYDCRADLGVIEKVIRTPFARSVIRPRPTCPRLEHEIALIDPSAAHTYEQNAKCPPLSNTFIDGKPLHCRFNHNDKIKSFRRSVCSATDVSMRPMLFLQEEREPHRDLFNDHTKEHDANKSGNVNNGIESMAYKKERIDAVATYGEHIEELECRWGKKFYGQVTFGPRNYPYPSSRWLARRYQMKKHRILKRYRFRRYKLAAVANLPFSKMIRVGMLPELKSSKTKKGDAVDAALTSQLVDVAKGDTNNKTKGRRSRPKSKYQVERKFI